MLVACDAFVQDLRYAVRSIRRARAFSLAVVLTLALGVGAATAMFTVLHGVLFRPLPYADADRLVIARMERTVEGSQAPVRALFPLEHLDVLKHRADAFDAVAFYAITTSVVSARGFSETVHAAAVSDGFFRTVQGRLREGRGWSTPDEARGAVVISQRLRTRLFGPGPAVGLPLRIDSAPYEVVGIAGDDYQVPDRQTDLWLAAPSDGPCCPYAAVARLRPGQTVTSAAAAVNALIGSLGSEHPRVYGGARAAVLPMREALAGDVRPTVWLMMCAAGLLLAVASANAAVLLTARTAARWRDTVLRVALGATARRLWSQSLAHAVLLVGCATVAGWGLAYGVVRLLQAFDAAVRLPAGVQAFRLDLPVLLFTAAAALLVVIVTSVVPALAPIRRGRVTTSAAGMSDGRTRLRVQHTLIVAQLAAAVVLLMTAVTMAAGLARLMTTDLGIRPDNVVAAAINLTYERALGSAQQAALAERLTDRIGALPGVQAAAVGASLPPSVSNLVVTLKRAGDAVDYQAAAVPATPGYFAALGMQLLEGRVFSMDDVAGREEVMIVSAATARRFFGDGTALGRTLRLPVLRDGAPSSADVRLVGIVANVKYSGLQAAADDVIFRPYGQQPWPAGFVVVRTDGDPSALLRSIREEIAAIDPAIAVGQISTLPEIIATEAARPRLRRAIVSTLAVLALAIAAAGLHGVVAFGVSQRRREFGVRLALGATRADITRLVLLGGSKLAVAGLALGFLAAHAAVRALAATYAELSGGSWIAYAASAVVLVCVAGAATVVPARRAASSDPLVALRAE